METNISISGEYTPSETMAELAKVLHGDPSAPKPFGVMSAAEVNMLTDLPTAVKKVRPIVGSSVPCGRNAPCPCGSGRKWKKCHARPTDDAKTPELVAEG